MVGMIHVLLSASRRAVLEMAAGLRKQRREGDARSCVFDTDARSATDHLFRAAGGKDALAKKRDAQNQYMWLTIYRGISCLYGVAAAKVWTKRDEIK